MKKLLVFGMTCYNNLLNNKFPNRNNKSIKKYYKRRKSKNPVSKRLNEYLDYHFLNVTYFQNGLKNQSIFDRSVGIKGISREKG